MQTRFSQFCLKWKFSLSDKAIILSLNQKKINENVNIIVKYESESRFKPDSNHWTERDHHAAPSSYAHTFPGDVFAIRVYLDKAGSIRQKGQVIKISGRSAAPW